MFQILIMDGEAVDGPRPVSTIGRFETMAEAHDVAHALMDRMETLIPDWTMVYTYEIVPMRDQATTEAYFISLINLFETAGGREWTTIGYIMEGDK